MSFLLVHANYYENLPSIYTQEKNRSVSTALDFRVDCSWQHLTAQVEDLIDKIIQRIPCFRSQNPLSLQYLSAAVLLIRCQN